MIWAISESSASLKTAITHATTRVSSYIDVKRAENHQGIVSTRFNFNIPQEWLILKQLLSLLSKRRCAKSERKPFDSLSATYAMRQFAEESGTALLTWLYGAKIPCAIEKICRSTRKRYLNQVQRICRHGLSLILFVFHFFFLPVTRSLASSLLCLVTPGFAQ